jgi:hypothetical protein
METVYTGNVYTGKDCTHPILLGLEYDMQKLTPLVAGFSTSSPGFNSRTVHVRFAVGKAAALGKFLSEYFTFPCR